MRPAKSLREGVRGTLASPVFEYHSQQVHSSFVKGKGRTKVQTVSIKGKKGTKSVEYRDRQGRVTRKSSKRLTKKEIDCIQRCQFVPGLFKDCESCIPPLTPS